MAGHTINDRPASRFTIDWMLAAVALIAVALVVGSLWPSPRSFPPEAEHGAVDLRELSPSERLIFFEDYSFNAGGWTDGEIDHASPATGSVLRSLSGASLSRTIQVPQGTDRLRIIFDSIAGPDNSGVTATLSAQTTTGEIPFGEGRTRHWMVAEAPEGPVTLTLAGDGADWAIDNLYVIAEMSGAAPE